ncbi:MAG: hypothetical protein AAFO93_03990 [Pseudomonadota bacterium]
MTDWAILGAVAIGLLWAGVHFFVGGRQVARPLRVADLPDVVHVTAWMCWHMVSAILVTAPALALIGYITGGTDWLMAALVINAAIAIAGIAAKFVLRTPWSLLPQGLLFLPVVALLAFAMAAMA